MPAITIKKLRWRCRRGTKELDELLLNYLEQQYPQAPVLSQQQFIDILNWDNSILLDCLQTIPEVLTQEYPVLKPIFKAVKKPLDSS